MHYTTFNEKKIALYGNYQPVFDKPVASSAANVVLATNLQFKVNNSSITEELNSDAMHAEAIVTITDQFASVDFDSHVPKLGSRYARRYPANETHILMVDAHLAYGETLTVKLATGTAPGITALVTDKDGVSPTDFVEEFLLYATSGIVDQPHVRFSGSVPNEYTVQQVVGLYEGLAGLMFNAKIEHQNEPDITVTGTAYPKVTLTKFDGNTYVGSALPLAPFLEASNAYQTIFTGQGLCDNMESDLQDVNSYLCEILTELKRAWAYLGQAKLWFEEIIKLNPEASAQAAAQGAIDNIVRTLRYVENWINAANMVKGDLKLLMADYFLNFSIQDLNKMLADLAEDMKWAAGLTKGNILAVTGVNVTPTTGTNWEVDIKGTPAVGDVLQIDGVTVTVTGAGVTAADIGLALGDGASNANPAIVIAGGETPWTSITAQAGDSSKVDYVAATAVLPPTIGITPAPGSTLSATVQFLPIGTTSTTWQLTLTADFNKQVEAGSWLSYGGVKGTATAQTTLGSLVDAVFNVLNGRGAGVSQVTTTKDPAVVETWTASVQSGTPQKVVLNMTASAPVTGVPFDEGTQYVNVATSTAPTVNANLAGIGSTDGYASYNIFYLPNRTFLAGTKFRLRKSSVNTVYFEGTATAPSSANDIANSFTNYLLGTPSGTVTWVKVTDGWNGIPNAQAATAYDTSAGFPRLDNVAQLHLVQTGFTNVMDTLVLSISEPGMGIPIEAVGVSPSFPTPAMTLDRYFVLTYSDVFNVNDTFTFNGETFKAQGLVDSNTMIQSLGAYYRGGLTAPAGFVKVSGSKTDTTLSYAWMYKMWYSPTGTLPVLSRAGQDMPLVITRPVDGDVNGMYGQSIGRGLTTADSFTFCGNTLTPTKALTANEVYYALAVLVNTRTLPLEFSCPGFIPPSADLAAAAVVAQGLILQMNLPGEKGFVRIGGMVNWVISGFTTITFTSANAPVVLPSMGAVDTSLRRTANQTEWEVLVGGELAPGESVSVGGITVTNTGTTSRGGAGVAADLATVLDASVPYSAVVDGNSVKVGSKGWLAQVLPPSLSFPPSMGMAALPRGKTMRDFQNSSQPKWDFTFKPGTVITAGSTIKFMDLGLSFLVNQDVPASQMNGLTALLASGGTTTMATVLTSPILDSTWTDTGTVLEVSYGGVIPIGNLNPSIIITDPTSTLSTFVPPQASYFVPNWWEDAWYVDFSGTFEKGDKVEMMGQVFTVEQRSTSGEVALAVYQYLKSSVVDPRISVLPSIDAEVVYDGGDFQVVGFKNSRLVFQRKPVITGGYPWFPDSVLEGKIIVTKTLTNPSDISVLCGSNLDDQGDIVRFMDTIYNSGMDATTVDPRLQQTMLEYQRKAIGYVVEARKLMDLALVQTNGLGTSKQNVSDLLQGMLNRVVASHGTSPMWVGTRTRDPQDIEATPTGWSTGVLTTDLCPCLDHLCFSNQVASPDMLTLQVRRSSVQLIGQQKTAIVKDARALVDLTLETGKRPMLTFHFQGNLHDTLQMGELTAPIKRQKYDVADVMAAKTVRNASLTDTCGVGAGLGCDCYGEYWNNICLVKGNFPNFMGFARARVQTTCGNMWSYARTPWEFTLEVIQEKADTANPLSFNVEDSLGKTFNFRYEQGGTAGETMTVDVQGAVLKDYADGNTQGVVTHVLTFVATGVSRLCLR